MDINDFPKPYIPDKLPLHYLRKAIQSDWDLLRDGFTI